MATEVKTQEMTAEAVKKEKVFYKIHKVLDSAEVATAEELNNMVEQLGLIPRCGEYEEQLWMTISGDLEALEEIGAYLGSSNVSLVSSKGDVRVDLLGEKFAIYFSEDTGIYKIKFLRRATFDDNEPVVKKGAKFKK